MKDDKGTTSSSDDGSGDTSGSNSNQTLSVEVDGAAKDFTVEDVKNLVSQQASATQKTQQVSAILKTCEKFDLDPESFVGQAEGAFNVISDLIDKGLVDEQGTILQKKKDNNDINFSKSTTDKSPNFSENKVLDLVTKALEPLTKKLGVLEQDQTQLTRLRISDSIKGKFKNLEDKDISQLFAVAGSDRSKTLVQHAEELSNKKVMDHSDLRKEFAKEFGVDLTNFDANKLLEQDADGGAGAIFKGKAFSFKKGKDNVSPRKAMKDFFERK